MLILKLILQILAVVSALLTNTLDYKVYDKRRRLFKRLRVWLYCVAVLSLGGGLAVTVGDDIARRAEIAELRLELNRNLRRIDDIGMEFVIYLPMGNPDHTGIAAYTKRVVPLLRSLASSLPSQEPTTWGPVSVPYISKSPLLPDLKTERVAYTFLSHVCIGLEIFADSAKAEAFANEAGHSQGVGDLVFLLARSAGEAERNDVILGIDVDKNRFLLNGANAKTGPAQKNTGRIVSLPDLAGATAVVYFCPKGYQDEAEKREFLSIANELQLVSFGLNFSGGQRMFLRPEGRLNKYGERFYVFKFPQTAQQVEDLIQK
jgi:hypothetical protein